MKGDALALSHADVATIPATPARRQVPFVLKSRPKRRCRQCDGRLPFFRTLFKAVFCTAAHEREFHARQEELGVQRLLDSAKRLQACENAVTFGTAPLTSAPFTTEPREPQTAM